MKDKKRLDAPHRPVKGCFMFRSILRCVHDFNCAFETRIMLSHARPLLSKVDSMNPLIKRFPPASPGSPDPGLKSRPQGTVVSEMAGANLWFAQGDSRQSPLQKKRNPWSGDHGEAKEGRRGQEDHRRAKINCRLSWTAVMRGIISPPS
jgi:hypothetical protein